jgi:hypothetical protein
MFMKYHSTDNGFCRVYYRDEARRLFCFQDDGSWGRVKFVFYVCSRDGEPSHQASWDNLELDQMPPAEERTAREFSAWFPTRAAWVRVEE